MSVEGLTEDDESMLSLDNQICFHLYVASRAITSTYIDILEAFDLTYPQYIVMLALWEGDDVPIGTIGRRLLLDFGTLSPLLKRLESKSLIRRVRNLDDERQVKIMLTREGRELKSRAGEIPKQLKCRLKLREGVAGNLRNELRTLIRNLVGEEGLDPAPSNTKQG